MSTIDCDVVLLPDSLRVSRAISESKKLQQFDSLYVLKDGEYYPHLSLYMLQLKTDDLPKVKEMLSVIARTTTPLQLHAYRYNHVMSFIDVEYKRIVLLDSLQNQIVVALNPIRDGMREKDKARMLDAEGIALKNLQDYGYKGVGELFRPHITLTRLESDNPSALQVLTDVSNFDGTFLNLGILEMGENDTAIRKLAEFELLGSTPKQ